MRKGIWIKAQLSNIFSRLAIIGIIDGVQQKEFRLSLGRISLDGNNHRRANEYAVLSLLNQHKAALFYAEALAQFRRYYDRSALPDSRRLHW